MVGGMQRSITTLMNGMAARGHEVTLLTWDPADARAVFPIAPEIRWHRLDLGDTANRAAPLVWSRRARAVRRIVRSCGPDVGIVFRGAQFLVVRLYSLGLGVLMIAAERGAPSRFEHMRGGSRMRLVEFNGMRLAKRIAIQSEGYRSQYPAFLQDKIAVIPNPVFPADRRASPELPDREGRLRVLSVGRLSHQKNYESLIRAFAGLAGRFPSWDLVILGEGDRRAALEGIVHEAGLSGRVRLPGAKSDVAEWYQDSHLFCLPSRHEGFPNALAEAQAHGLPSVAFAGCAGMDELIQDGRTGLLAPGNGDVEALSRSLANMMGCPERRRAMGEAGPKAMEAYRPDIVMDAWERLFEAVRER